MWASTNYYIIAVCLILFLYSEENVEKMVLLEWAETVMIASLAVLL